MERSNLIKAFLFTQVVVVFIYTIFAFKAEGADLFSVFLRNINDLGWSGQFNLDFLCYLILSGLWIMWRNQFTSKSIFLGLAAMVLGIVLLAPYSIWLINQEKGNLKKVLIGDR
jgi:hypothetical protein